MKPRYRSAFRTRERILRTIEAQPGLRAADLITALELSENTVRKHVQGLVLEKRVSVEETRGKHRFYRRTAEVPDPRSQKIHSVLTDPAVRAVYRSFINEGTTAARLADLTGLGRNKVQRALSILSEHGLFERLGHTLWRRLEPAGALAHAIPAQESVGQQSLRPGAEASRPDPLEHRTPLTQPPE